MRYIKRILLVLLLILGVARNLSADVYTSPNYRLTMPRISSGSGAAGSPNFLIERASIGAPYSGTAGSSSYTLNANIVINGAIVIPPNTPRLNDVTSPTNITTCVLSGLKDPNTSIYINGYEAVLLDSNTTWSCDVSLTEGENYFLIDCRNADGLTSEAVLVTIDLDTIAPIIIIGNPLDYSFVFDSQITVDGTIDEDPFTEEKTLDFGLNTVSIEASDEAGNVSSEEIKLYRIREPLGPPQM